MARRITIIQGHPDPAGDQAPKVAIMYRNILLPIDGTQLSLRAARHGIRLAKALNARVTAIMVTTPWATQFAREVAVVIPGVLVPQNEYDLRTETAACNCLLVVTDETRSAGVPSRALHVRHRDPYLAIIDAVREHGCDLIVMASHGRPGVPRAAAGERDDQGPEPQPCTGACLSPALTRRWTAA